MSLYHLYNPLIWMTRAAAASSEVFETIDAPVLARTTFEPSKSLFESDLYFRNVDFAYPGRPHNLVLNGVDIDIESGKVTAIIGPSGSGKSTIVALIEKWYEVDKQADKSSSKTALASEQDLNVSEKTDPARTSASAHAHGSGISIGDVDINDIDSRWWRINIGIVQQEPFLFNDSVFENVANGLCGTPWEHTDSATKMAMVEHACQQAFADGFIAKLPRRYHTSVGEGGMKLSGGQRQRIAIARAIIKQPALLILDEATSAIDVRSEKIVQKALDQASKHRTTIVIAHRLSTVRKASKIVVLRDGKVIDHGTHQELFQRGGVYSQMVQSQEISFTEGESVLNEQVAEDDEEPVVDRDTSQEICRAVKSVDGPKKKGFFRCMAFLVYDSRSKGVLLCLTILAAIVAGGRSSISSKIDKC